ncbi:hypothetical protein CN543_02020 [Bacillus toyonensis]|uniref:hypothetical protein n=1 Tax=Bacillus toyonensis TaxID=155322 RepID=UPI000BEF4037|nr:hypothetical protein [Bacillus toyonensis]PEL23059.1 hypothetical protein CN624_22730 [Bacillus toyonensis]PEN40451.1 hypothetical protein CN543_02020 [Bacillus toyonensis]PFY54783.1 hypothetical protein COL52_27630 [Bacillus toyonensis]PHB23538.1 hypothetical protein COE88_13185 [Bacillus toyonensis]
MFYNNQPPYPQQPFYPQQPEQRYTEQYEEQELQQPEQQYEQNPYATPQAQEQQNPYVTQPQQPQYQQQMYQPNYDARVSPPKPPTIDPTQPQILPPGPTLDITQPQILPPGPITEPTQQQIQQVVGTQFLPLKKPVLDFVKPWVDYGLNEAKHTSHKHALTEVAAIMFLVGKGYNPTIAHYIVESWEKNEQF